MSGTHATERAYAILKASILSGAYAPGQRLEPRHIGESINMSASPIREALNRLAGERLVLSMAGAGFSLPAFDVTVIVDLLRWNERLSLLALRAATLPTDWPEPAIAQDAEHAERTAAFFRTLGSLANNQEIFRALNSASDHLHRFRSREPELLADLEDELKRLETSLRHDPGDLARRLRIYHRRRAAIVTDVARLVSSSKHPSER